MKKGKKIKTLLIILMLFITVALNAQDKKIPQPKGKDSYQLPTFPKVPSPQSAPYTVIKVDFTITLRDNVVLDCSKFYPNVSNPFLPNGYPAVIMVHGYGDRKETLEGFASAQASFGYCVYTFSVRGQGNSGGLSNLISIVEAQDLIEVVNYVKHDQPSGLDSSNVLITGGSQGGILPYMANCNGMNVKCIISALSSPTFASSWIENGSIKMTFLWTISYTPDTARYDNQVTAMQSWVYSNALDKWDSLATWLPVGRDFKNQLSQATVPIMLENAWQDKFFNALGNISTIPSVNVPKRYYFGAVRGHGGEFSTTEDTWHENFFNEWFFYWLFGINNNILTRPIFHYAYTTYPTVSPNTMWTFVHDSSSVWPPTGLTDLKIYFNQNGQLKTTPNTNSTQNVVLNNTVSNNLTMLQAVDDEFKGTQFNNRFKKAQLVFNSAPLTQNLLMVGNQFVNLDYSSSANVCQFNFQIYEVSSTQTKLVTRVNYTDRKNTVLNLRKQKAFYGVSHSHEFRAGNRIRIVVTNLDTAPDDTSFLGSNPHVLPVLTNGKHKLFLSNNSYIDLQVKYPTTHATGLFINEGGTTSQTDNNNTPVSFSLKQNFPNPFNPSTVIEFSVPNDEFVTLKVYDMTGREIATLVNEQKSTGSYSINFNADAFHLSSGIYFYKLSAGSNVSVKKLTLIK